MLRIPRTRTRANDQRPAVLSLNLTQKIILTLLVAALATVPLWLGLARVQSAPAAPVSPPASPTPSVTISAPAKALIGTQVKFKVTFTNGTALGYGPFLDVVLDAGGANITKPPQTSPCTCDGITFVSAQLVGVNGGPIPLTPIAALTAPCSSAPNTITHPFFSSGVLPVTVPAGGQLITLALPFGSFQKNQPPIEVEITANISINADAGHALAISARGGFRFGTLTPLDDPSSFPDPPVFSDESSPGIQVGNSTAWKAQAKITPSVMIINKKYLGPEGENATGPNFIGVYPLRYQLTVDVAPGQTITNVVLTDCLPDNMAFHQLVSVSPAATSTTLPPIDIPSASGCLTVNWSSLTGSAAVVFEFFIPEKDAQGNPILPADCKPAVSKDNLNITADWTPVDSACDGPLQHLSEGPVVDTLLDKCIAIQKSVSMFTETGAIGYTPGDTVEYKLNFQISDYKTFSAINITDSLGDGQQLVGPATLVVKDQFGTVSGNFALNSDLLSAPYNGSACGIAVGGTTLTFLVSQKMINLAPPDPRHAAGILTGGFATTPSSSTPATGQIVFHAEILDRFAVTQQPGDQFVDKEDPLSNCVVIDGKLMTNVNPPTLPTSTGVDGHDDSSQTISIIGDTLKKTVYAVKRANTFGVFNTVCGPPTGPGGTSCSNFPNPPQEVRPGDQVTYRLEKTIPSSDAEHLVIEDWLPLPTYNVTGINFNNVFCSGIPIPGSSCLGPGDQMHSLLPLKPAVSLTTTNGFTFDYGTFNDPTNTPRKIDLLFTYQVTNFPFADELFLTNEAQECETNTFGASFCQVAIAQVNLRQPNLKIHKGTIATNNGLGEFTHQGPQTTNLSLAQAPAGATFSLLGINGVVNHADVAAGLMDSDLGNVDANDIVTFAITIENLGGSPAYDVKIEDIIPANSGVPSCFTIVSGSIVVKRGTGAVVASPLYSIQPANPGATTTSFTITSTPGLPIPISAFNAANATTGANIVTITFQATLLADILPGCCDNTAKLLHYSSTLNGPDFVAANLTPPFTDTATVCVKPKLTKSLVTTSEAHTLLSDVTIGEIVGYRLVVQLPETGLLTNFQVTDALPPGLKFRNDGTARIVFVSNGPGIFHPAFGPALGPPFNVFGNQTNLPGLTLNASQTIPSSATAVGASCGDDPVFNLGPIKNNNSDSDLEFIVIEFNALVCNEASNVNGTPLPNTFSVSAGGNQIATSNSINVNIVEPNLAMTKTVAPNPAVKGQTLTYTVQYTNNGSADAFDVVLQDTLPSGLTLGTITATCPFTSGGNAITMTCAQVPKAPASGSTVIVTYQAVANPANCPVTLNNRANVTWTSLPGLQGTTVNPTGSSTPGNSGAVDGERDGVTPLLTLNDYAAPVSAAVKIDCPCEALITGLKFNDLNGNGVRDTGEPALANWTIQVTDSNAVTHTTTTDSQGNYSFTVPAPGTYTVAEVLQSGWTQTAPTTGTYSVTVSPGQVVTNLNFGNRKKQNKCDLQIRKEVKPNPLVSGQQATAIITVNNVGTDPCHGPTKVAESMPAGLTPVSASVPGGSCVVATGVCTYPPAIPAGASVVFTYVFNVTAQPGMVIMNCATLKNASDSNAANNKACVEVKVEGGQSGSLTVTKTVKNLWTMPFPAGTNFPVAVSCLPSGPNVTLNLAAGGIQTVNNIPAGSTCTVTEGALPPPVPHPACPSLEWGTPSYSPGQTVTIPSTGGSQTVTVTNTYFCNTTPSCATPPSGMVAWWPLDETSGNVVHSIVGNHDGTLPVTIGSSISVASAPKVGSALFFGAAKAEVADDPALDFGKGDFSIDAWVRSFQSNLLSAVVDKLDTSTTTHRGYAFFVQNGMVQLRIGDGVSTGTYQSSNTFVADGTWRHVAVTVKRVGGIPVGQFYIDGVQAGSPFQPLAIDLDNSAKLLIGSFRLGNNTCSCEVSLDEIELFNTALKPADIKSIFQADKKGKCKPTITGSKFNDPNGNGVREPGEPGLANWTIKVTDSKGITQTTTTDSAGNYSVTVSAPETYTVAEVLQSGWTQTAPTSGTYSVNVSPGQVINNRDFGNKKQEAGSLIVTKTVENLSPSPIPAGTSFPVNVSCLPSGPNVTLTLTAGGTQTVNNIPVGSKCTVTEAPLPSHLSSPTCPSLQWAAPTYAPGQSVIVPNSGAPQTVTVQNRLLCMGDHPVGPYTFTGGMNEFCVWGGGGYGSYNSLPPIDNPNSQNFFNPPQTVNNRGVGFGALGLCYGRILTANNKVAFKYTFNATPVTVLSYPDVNSVFIDRPGQFPVSATRRNVFGAGLSPIGLQLYFRPQSRIKPFVNTSAGFIFFKDQLPRLNGARFNFAYDFGGGVQVFRDANRAFTLGYKYQRITNGGRTPNDPGFGGNVFYLGYSIFK